MFSSVNKKKVDLKKHVMISYALFNTRAFNGAASSCSSSMDRESMDAWLWGHRHQLTVMTQSVCPWPRTPVFHSSLKGSLADQPPMPRLTPSF